MRTPWLLRHLFARVVARTLGSAFLVGLCVTQLAACSGSPPSEPESSLSDDDRYSRFGSMVDDAVASQGDQISDAQVVLLMQAKREDAVSFELVVEAVNNAFACMEGVDAFGTWLEPDTSEGFPIPAYKYGTALGRDEADWLPVAEECLKRESSVVEWLYQTQPKAVALEAEYFDEVRRPQIVACLVENGVDVPADATREDIDLMVVDLYNKSSGMAWVDNGDGSKSGYPTTPDLAVQCDWDTR